MAKKDDEDRKETPAQDRTKEALSRFNNDYDLYDWSGKQVDRGADVRKKGSDR
jgi:hypothetical protein